MFKKWSDRWAEYMVVHGADSAQKTVYSYGLQCLLNELFSDCLLLILAFFLHRVWDAVVWIVIFDLLRQNIGGYHAGTLAGCMAGSTAVGVCSILGYRLFAHSRLLMLVTLLFCLLIVILIAPVLNPRHPLSMERQKKARYRAILLTSLLGAAAMLSFDIHVDFSAMITASVLSVCLLGLAGALVQMQRKEQHL